MKHDAVIDRLPVYAVSSSSQLDYSEKEAWLKLDWNESPTNASPLVIEAITRFLQEHSLSYYPDVTSKELIGTIAEKYNVPPECISVFNGSDNALQHIFYAFLSEDSTFVSLEPTYTQILQFVNFKRPRVLSYKPDRVFDIDYQRFEKDFIGTADVVYLINPHNPTGTLLKRSYLQGLISRFPKTLFVIDEAYMEFASTDESCIHLLPVAKNVAVTRTFSKAYGLAGIRLGFAVSSAENIGLIQRIKNNKDINTLAQIAGIAALRDTGYLDTHVNRIRATREAFLQQIEGAFPTVGSEANFVLVNYGAEQGLVDRLRQNRILVRDRSDQHGLANYLRVTIGTEHQMKRVAEVLLNGPLR